MPAWTLWLFLLALLTLPILLRLRAGDEPDNTITHEQPAGDDQEHDGDPGPMLAALRFPA